MKCSRPNVCQSTVTTGACGGPAGYCKEKWLQQQVPSCQAGAVLKVFLVEEQ